MKKKNLIKLLLFLFIVMVLSITFSINSMAKAKEEGKVKWLKYNEGLAKAKKEDKPIFIDFYTDWCHYCKLMEQQTFSDSKVSKLIKESFIAIRVNADKEKDVTSKYRITGYPNVWFLKSNGEPIGVLPGFVKADVFLNILEYIRGRYYEKMNFKQYMEKKK
ncbi:MAG: DUF255 domain-containing protein [Deltaproteobacteria bacterium]|nr:DUF255 domain-containing protein [Deltaproteobacteria bacterium]